MSATVNIGSITMPAGEYWVGDPCYGVADDRWMEWLEAADYMSEPRYLVADLDGRSVLGISTAYGDGEYQGDDGNSYPVDAGLIGLVPVSLVEGEPFGMNKQTFDNDFTCSYEDGTICLGHIYIDTDPEYDGSDWR